MRIRSIAVLALCACLAAVPEAQRPEQAPGTIRSSVTIVPIDVRVLDGRGNAVTDLTRDDFVVLEDGVPQKIGHFSAHGLTPDLELAKVGSLRPGIAPAGIEPANRRVFLLMLARGRHEDVTRSITALESFLTERLLPQDQVALLAWNRATDFTTDHALIRETVRRYRERNGGIETRLSEWFSSLRAEFGPRDIPESIQSQIDDVFANARGLRPREVTPGQITDERGVQAILKGNKETLQQAALEAGRAFPEKMIDDPFATARAEMIGIPLDQYAAQNIETVHDMGALYAGLDYLRYLDGEKHLVLFTAAGLRLPRGEDSTSLGRVAANARITIHTVHTGGTVGASPTFMSGGGIQMPAIPSSAQVRNQGFAVGELRQIAEMTGGRASAFTMGDVALDRIDRASRFQYLLGYTPINGTNDGKFRKVEVTVRRPGLTVSSRQGYFATRQPVGLDKQRLRTERRIMSAAEYDQPVQDLKITLQAPTLTKTSTGARIAFHVRVPIAQLAFVEDQTTARAHLELAVFFADSRERLLHEVREPVTLPLTTETRQRYTADGVPLRLDLEVPAGVRLVKVVVYDPGSDLLGSAIGRIR